jgi:hypothetical protein
MQNEWANEQWNVESMKSDSNLLLLKENKPKQEVTTSKMERNFKKSFVFKLHCSFINLHLQSSFNKFLMA